MNRKLDGSSRRVGGAKNKVLNGVEGAKIHVQEGNGDRRIPCATAVVGVGDLLSDLDDNRDVATEKCWVSSSIPSRQTSCPFDTLRKYGVDSIRARNCGSVLAAYRQRAPYIRKIFEVKLSIPYDVKADPIRDRNAGIKCRLGRRGCCRSCCGCRGHTMLFNADDQRHPEGMLRVHYALVAQLALQELGEAVVLLTSVATTVSRQQRPARASIEGWAVRVEARSEGRQDFVPNGSFA